MTLPSGDARDIIRELDITSEEDDCDYWIALQKDEAFTVACQRYKRASLYAGHEHSTDEEKQIPTLLEDAIYKHAARVLGEVDE